MERTPVVSSNLASVGYDAEKQILEVEFKGSGIYHYLDVPPEIHKRLLKAESPGKYFVHNIRGAFKMVKPEPEKQAEEAGTGKKSAA